MTVPRLFAQNLAFCPHCGKDVSPEAISCPNCGHPLKQVQPVAKPMEQISAWWWLLPFFLAWIGGVHAYIVLKDRNEKTATNMLILGVVWTFVGIIVLAVLNAFLLLNCWGHFCWYHYW